METENVILSLGKLFAGLDAKRDSLNEMLSTFNPEYAFQFNTFNLFTPGENKITEILGYFLNPNAAHGQGVLFLDLFLKEFCNSHFVFERVDVQTEYTLPSGRRIDLLLVLDLKFAIAIENKIWAKDQDGQLLDYSDFLQEKYGNEYVLFYLNPYKSHPSENSITKTRLESLLNRQLFIIDYSTEMITLLKKWILYCKAYKVKLFLKDFEQYLQQEINGETFMNEHEITAEYALKNEENLEIAAMVIESENNIKLGILSVFIDRLKALKEKNNWEIEINTPFDKAYNGFYITTEQLRHKQLRIGFEFEYKWYDGFAYGLVGQGSLDALAREKMSKELNFKMNVKGLSSKGWPWYTYWDEYKSWNMRTFVKIHNPLFVTKIESIVNEISKIIAEID